MQAAASADHTIIVHPRGELPSKLLTSAAALCSINASRTVARATIQSASQQCRTRTLARNLSLSWNPRRAAPLLTSPIFRRWPNAAATTEVPKFERF